MSEEQYLDDPIRITDEEHKLVSSYTSECNGLTLENKREESNYVSKDSAVNNTSLASINGRRLLSQCKSFHIKLYDILKYPQYYKFAKKIQIKNMSSKEATTNKKKVSCYTKLGTQNEKFGNKPKQNIIYKDLKTAEIVTENAKTNMNLNDVIKAPSINFKKNIGLIGIKISNVGLLSSDLVRRKRKEIKNKDSFVKNEIKSSAEEKRKIKYDKHNCNSIKKVTKNNGERLEKRDYKDTPEKKQFSSKVLKNQIGSSVQKNRNATSKHCNEDNGNIKLVSQDYSEKKKLTTVESFFFSRNNKKRGNVTKFTKPPQDKKYISYTRSEDQPEIGIVRPMINTLAPTQSSSITINDFPSYKCQSLDRNASMVSQQNKSQKNKDLDSINLNHQDCTDESKIQTNQDWVRRVQIQDSCSNNLSSLNRKICKVPLGKQFDTANEQLLSPRYQTLNNQVQGSNTSQENMNGQMYEQPRYTIPVKQSSLRNGPSPSVPHRYSPDQQSSNISNNHKQGNQYQPIMTSLSPFIYTHPGMRTTLHYGESQSHQGNYGHRLPNQPMESQRLTNPPFNANSQHNHLLSRRPIQTRNFNSIVPPNKTCPNQESRNLYLNCQPAFNQNFSNHTSTNPLPFNRQQAPNQHLVHLSLESGQPVWLNLPVNNQSASNQDVSYQSSVRNQSGSNQIFENQYPTSLPVNRQPTPNQNVPIQSLANNQPAWNQNLVNQYSRNLPHNSQPARNQNVPIQLLDNNQPALFQTVSNQPAISDYIYKNPPPYPGQQMNQIQLNQHIPLLPVTSQCTPSQPGIRQSDEPKPTDQPAPPQTTNQSIIGCNSEGLVKRINIQNNKHQNMKEPYKDNVKLSSGPLLS